MPSDRIPRTHLNRRGFLSTFGAFALMTGLGAQRSRPVAAGLLGKRSVGDLHLADFAPLLGQSFTVYTLAAASHRVRLAAVKQDAAKASHAHGEYFSLAFSGPKGQAFPQGTYTFAHPRLGHFDLFVVPTMPVAHEERHIAIINRI